MEIIKDLTDKYNSTEAANEPIFYGQKIISPAVTDVVMDHMDLLDTALSKGFNVMIYYSTIKDKMCDGQTDILSWLDSKMFCGESISHNNKTAYVITQDETTASETGIKFIGHYLLQDAILLKKDMAKWLLRKGFRPDDFIDGIVEAEILMDVELVELVIKAGIDPPETWIRFLCKNKTAEAFSQLAHLLPVDISELMAYICSYGSLPVFKWVMENMDKERLGDPAGLVEKLAENGRIDMLNIMKSHYSRGEFIGWLTSTGNEHLIEHIGDGQSCGENNF